MSAGIALNSWRWDRYKYWPQWTCITRKTQYRHSVNLDRNTRLTNRWNSLFAATFYSSFAFMESQWLRFVSFFAMDQAEKKCIIHHRRRCRKQTFNLLLEKRSLIIHLMLNISSHLGCLNVDWKWLLNEFKMEIYLVDAMTTCKDKHFWAESP